MGHELGASATRLERDGWTRGREFTVPKRDGDRSRNTTTAP
jgi:hypothetical protein